MAVQTLLERLVEEQEGIEATNKEEETRLKNEKRMREGKKVDEAKGDRDGATLCRKEVDTDTLKGAVLELNELLEEANAEKEGIWTRYKAELVEKEKKRIYRREALGKSKTTRAGDIEPDKAAIKQLRKLE